MSEPSADTRTLHAEMSVVAAGVAGIIAAGYKAGLTKDAAALAGMVGVLSYIRVDGLNEEAILKEARRASEHPHQLEIISNVRDS